MRNSPTATTRSRKVAKFKNRVVYTRGEARFYQKAWLFPKILALTFIGVGIQKGHVWLIAPFFILASVWTVKLIWGLLRGKYTGIR